MSSNSPVIGPVSCPMSLPSVVRSVGRVSTVILSVVVGECGGGDGGRVSTCTKGSTPIGLLGDFVEVECVCGVGPGRPVGMEPSKPTVGRPTSDLPSSSSYTARPSV